MSGFVKVARRDELDDGQVMAVQAGDAEIVLACVAGEVHAVDAICNHGHGYLDQGWLDGHAIVCPLHGGSFDLRSGAPVAPPCEQPIKRYAVRIEGGDILVDPAGQ